MLSDVLMNGFVCAGDDAFCVGVDNSGCAAMGKVGGYCNSKDFGGVVGCCGGGRKINFNGNCFSLMPRGSMRQCG